jgi:ABC-type lipoprotein export system ATPase subunit
MFEHIRLEGIMPSGLPESFGQDSEVWKSDFQINRGEHTLISASSGRGKSTLISILYGLKQQFSGKYFVNGIESSLLRSADWSQLRSQDISIVFQDLRLFPNLTVEENLLLKGNLKAEEFDFSEAVNMCEALGIGRYLKQKCGSLSFGERQRVAIVRALIQQAGLILMDEPFSHLDRDNADKALELILRKSASTKSAILITSLGQDYGWKYDRILEL